METAKDDSRDQARLRFVERFALVLADSGVPRMPARVFAYLLSADSDRHTAAELVHGLRVSAGAVSGAVRYLTQIGVLVREREPGARVDHRRLTNIDIFNAVLEQRAGAAQGYEEVAAEGVASLGPASPGGRRMRETQEFFAFMRAERPRILARWEQHRRAGGQR